MNTAFEQMASAMGYFEMLTLSPEQIKKSYENVCQQAAYARDPEYCNQKNIIQETALQQLHLADAQSLIYIITNRDDPFVADRTRANAAAQTFILIKTVLVWNN